MTLPKPHAILFDLDDTLISEGARHTLLLEIANELADRLRPVSPVAVAAALEHALHEFWTSAASKEARLSADGRGPLVAREQVILQYFSQEGVPLTDEVARDFSDLFSSRRAGNLQVYADAEPTLHALSAKGIRLALVTNGPSAAQWQKIERFGLTRWFDHIHVEGDHGFGKPDDEAYLQTLRALNVQPADAWMVGDNLEWEVATPQRLAMQGIWHDHRGVGLPENSQVKPDAIIQALSELVPIAS